MSDAAKTAIVDAYRQFQDKINDDAQLDEKMSVFIYSNDYESFMNHALLRSGDSADSFTCTLNPATGKVLPSSKSG